MPDYLAPGVFVEETSFRGKSIEGVSTTTTGFVGPTRFGPIGGEPELLTSLDEFERIYGDGQRLGFDGGANTEHNFMWHAARAFFGEGGKRLYVARIFRCLTTDGNASGRLPATGDEGRTLTIRARFPGVAGNQRVCFTLQRGPNGLGEVDGVRQVHNLAPRDVVWIRRGDSASSGALYLSEKDATTQRWHFKRAGEDLELDTAPALSPSKGAQICIVTVTLSFGPMAVPGAVKVWEGIALDPLHEYAGVRDCLTAQFAQQLADPALARRLPVVITLGNQLLSGLDIAEVLFAARPTLRDSLGVANSTEADRSVELVLAGGNDGTRPTSGEYLGAVDEASGIRTGLRALETIEDISIVAAPGSTADYPNYRNDANAIYGLLINHAEQIRYRIAVLDSPPEMSIADVRRVRAKLDSKYAAFYYPWVTVLDPITRQELNLPPSGFVSGIYARNDIERAVYKAPANEVVHLAIGFEQLLNKAQQEVLNPEGINCFRFLEGRGYRLWGARTISSDPEWKYVNLRRYFAYLEHSIDKGTQWAVFEPNGEALWANVRRTIEDFLLNEWQSGALLGEKPEKAYFVKCDRSTMTQNDVDNGRLICLIGVAPLRPAEFVIFRIGQWTADHKT